MQGTVFLAGAVLVATAVVCIAVTVLQTYKISGQRQDWDQEILRFRGTLNSVSKRKMDNVIRAYGLQVDTATSNKFNEDEDVGRSRIRWITQKHRVFPDLVKWEVVDAPVDEARWMLVKKDHNSTNLAKDVMNGDVRHLLLEGRVLDVRAIAEEDFEDAWRASSVPSMSDGASVSKLVAFQVGRSSIADDAVDTAVLSPLGQIAGPPESLNNGTGMRLVHVWGYGVRRSPRIV